LDQIPEEPHDDSPMLDRDHEHEQIEAEHLDEHNMNEFKEDKIADNEVVTTSDANGEVVAHASQVTDYRLCSALYKNLTLWDFIAQIDKVKKKKKQLKSMTRRRKNQIVSQMNPQMRQIPWKKMTRQQWTHL
jgi:predicted GIY-YIG superfamily endonuclease